MSKKQGQAALKAIESAVASLFAEAPAKPAGKKVELHPVGEFQFEVTHVYLKVAEKVTSMEVLPGLTVETGTPRIRVELTSSAGVVREDFTVWTSPDEKKVWIGLAPILASLQAAALTDTASLGALVGKTGTFVVRHELIPAKDKFPARTVATVRPEKKAKA